MNENESQHVRFKTNGQVRKSDGVVTNTKQKAALGVCPHCGAAVEAGYEICPVCGHKLVDYCTFCGAAMLPTDIDCPECGMPSEGVICPQCGTLNFRSFCRKCNKPLSRVARKAVEKAKADPKVQEAARILARITQLEAEMDSCEDDGDPEDNTLHEPTEKELRLRELMANIGFTHAEIPKKQPQSSPSRNREALREEYQRMVEEANKLLEQMVPPAGSTPQEQRNYSTARKVAVMETYKVTVQVNYVEREDRMGWICNECQVFHDSPENCAVRQYGGHWVLKTVDVWKTKEEEVEKQKKVYKKLD